MADIEAIGRAIKQLQWRHHRAMESGLARAGTTLAQWDALRAIDREPAASAHTLALATFQSDQAFGTLAGRLEKQGLIRRSSGRGRAIEHHLTEAGERMLAAGRPVPAPILEASFAALSEGERETLRVLLERALGDDPSTSS